MGEKPIPVLTFCRRSDRVSEEKHGARAGNSRGRRHIPERMEHGSVAETAGSCGADIAQSHGDLSAVKTRTERRESREAGALTQSNGISRQNGKEEHDRVLFLHV